ARELRSDYRAASKSGRTAPCRGHGGTALSGRPTTAEGVSIDVTNLLRDGAAYRRLMLKALKLVAIGLLAFPTAACTKEANDTAYSRITAAKVKEDCLKARADAPNAAF